MYHVSKQNGSVYCTPSIKDIFADLKDGEYRMELKKEKNPRSLRQNSLLHSWLSQIERESHVGYEADEWKEIFRNHFLLSRHRSPINKKKWIIRLKSTTELSTIEFNEFLEKIRLSALTKHVGPIQLKYPDEIRFEEWIASFN